MRLAFTIIYQGSHLLHFRGFAARMLSMFDHWVVVEGAAKPNGSTAWCKRHRSPMQSNDGTREELSLLANKFPSKISFIPGSVDGWHSKDAMVNAALMALSPLAADGPHYLWQVDADEHWEEEQLQNSERELMRGDYCAGEFHCTYFVGDDLIARGEWGEGKHLPYRRIWLWWGQLFSSHEPPRLQGGDGKVGLLTERFHHFAYYFEKDVAFKAKYYRYHERVLDGWRTLQFEKDRLKFPVEITRLFGPVGPGRTNTQIWRLDKPVLDFDYSEKESSA